MSWRLVAGPEDAQGGGGGGVAIPWSEIVALQFDIKF